MSLIIPPTFRKDINRYSGFLDPDSKYAGATLKALFLSPVNIKYLTDELFSLITHQAYVLKTLGPEDEDYCATEKNRTRGATGFNNRAEGRSVKKSLLLIREFKKSRSLLNALMQEMVESHKLPYSEDLTTTNPVMQLHKCNLDFLLKSSANIIQNPNTLVADFYLYSPDTGAREAPAQWDYNSESFADGTWHPEHLFTQSDRNRDNPYWKPFEVTYDASSNAKGPGHRYNNVLYNRTGKYTQFPRWQLSSYWRHEEFDSTHVGETFAGQGQNDRRTQEPHGYDMSALVSRSTY